MQVGRNEGLGDPDQVAEAETRLTAAGVLDEIEEDTVCCHATQNKLWSHEPQGLRWEWYHITDDTPDGLPLVPEAASADAEQGACCT